MPLALPGLDTEVLYLVPYYIFAILLQHPPRHFSEEGGHLVSLKRRFTEWRNRVMTVKTKVGVTCAVAVTLNAF